METITTTVESLNNTDSTHGEVEKYAELIDRYGIMIVISAAFICLSFGIILIMLKSYMKTQNIIQAQNQTMFQTIIDNMSARENKELVVREEHRELVDTFVKISTQIRLPLDSLSNAVNADRTSVYAFHNGTNTSHGLPFIKISCLAEVMKKGTLITRKITNHQNLPLSTFDKSVSFLVSSQVAWILDNVEDERFPAIKNMLAIAGVLSAGFLAMYDDDNNMLGIIVTEFSERKTEEEMKEIIEVMKQESLKIIPVLDYADYQQTAS